MLNLTPAFPEFSIKDIFLLELDFLRNVKKMRLFMDESKKWHDSDYPTNIQYFDSLLLQFKQTVYSLFLTPLTNENPTILQDFLLYFSKVLKNTIEEQNKPEMMKVECISDLLVKYFWLKIFSNKLPNSVVLVIIDVLALLAKNLMVLKQSFVELEIKLLFSICQKIIVELEATEYESHLNDLIENLMASNFVNSKIIEFFIENLSNSDPTAFKYREKVRNLLVTTIFQKSSSIPLRLVVNFPELAVHPEVLRVLIKKYDQNLLKSMGFSKIQLDFICQEISDKPFAKKELGLTQNKLTNEELLGFLEVLLRGRLEEKIDVLMIFSDLSDNQEVFVKNAEKVRNALSL